MPSTRSPPSRVPPQTLLVTATAGAQFAKGCRVCFRDQSCHQVHHSGQVAACGRSPRQLGRCGASTRESGTDQRGVGRLLVAAELDRRLGADQPRRMRSWIAGQRVEVAAAGARRGVGHRGWAGILWSGNSIELVEFGVESVAQVHATRRGIGVRTLAVDIRRSCAIRPSCSPQDSIAITQSMVP